MLDGDRLLAQRQMTAAEGVVARSPGQISHLFHHPGHGVHPLADLCQVVFDSVERRHLGHPDQPLEVADLLAQPLRQLRLARGPPASESAPDQQPGDHRQHRRQSQRRHRPAADRRAEEMAPEPLAESICDARRPRQHRLVVEVAGDVRRQLGGRSVAAVRIFLERLHHDPVEIAGESAPQGR